MLGRPIVLQLTGTGGDPSSWRTSKLPDGVQITQADLDRIDGIVHGAFAPLVTAEVAPADAPARAPSNEEVAAAQAAAPGYGNPAGHAGPGFSGGVGDAPPQGQVQQSGKPITGLP